MAWGKRPGTAKSGGRVPQPMRQKWVSSGKDEKAEKEVVGVGNKNISSIRAMMDAQEILHGKTSAIAQWHNRPRTAATLRTSFSAAPKLSGMQQAEARHQQNLRDWHTQCVSYRVELQRWKRDVSRGTNSEGSFPAFHGRH